ncbi:major facilitator superfamily domain-containing protein 8 [Lingula anatina]|uniref:Major facilitator superfamily domain-containing protein 8 n=1 Tax=Lingula anatina TaxID=7574 RepID=A0A1S3IIG2_LINAN|nr:major facilitator superfamily domain-containing protein 8 [Lingula anatina]|eukprot:XP_013397289.1 major facilitator superfamily domain-containing protein 8 [Lingula anatina]
MNAKWKKRTTYITICTFWFFGGVEYAVILPTLWLYIHERYNAEQYFLGMILSAFSVTGLFAGPIMGRWGDKTRQTKLLLLFSNLWEIGGNIMYFLGISKWFLLGSRLVAGVGTGVGAAIIADVSRATHIEERTSVLATLMIARQVGLVVGPGLNLFLRKSNFTIGPYVVDAYTAPGLFMAVLWTVMQIVVLLFYHNLPELPAIKPKITTNTDPQMNGGSSSSYESRPTSNLHSVPDSGIHSESSLNTDRPRSISPSGLVDPGPIYESEQLLREHGEYVNSDNPQNQYIVEVKSATNQKLTWSYIRQEFLREEVVLLLFVSFVSMFMQTGLETFVTPLTKSLLNWGEFENSIMYCLAGVEVISVFILVHFLSKRLQDRTMILIGCLVEIACIAFMTYYLPIAKPETPLILPALILGIFLDVFGLPFMAVCGISLYSKITRLETQGFGHGLRRTMLGLGTILGPLWSGALLSRMYVMLGVVLGLLVLATVMLLLSFRWLKVERTSPVHTQSVQETEQEKAPLLPDAGLQNTMNSTYDTVHGTSSTMS